LERGRISEVLALTPAAIDIESGVANIETLKRRKRGIVRQVPLPRDSLRELISIAFSDCVSCNATPSLPSSGYGSGAERPHGGVLRK
jgi:integrase